MARGTLRVTRESYNAIGCAILVTECAIPTRLSFQIDPRLRVRMMLMRKLYKNRMFIFVFWVR